MKVQSIFIILSIIASSLSCSQKYYYATGEKAVIMGRKDLSLLLIAHEKNIAQKELVRSETHLNKVYSELSNPDDKLSGKSWDELSGVYLEFVEGESETSIFKKVGKPLSKESLNEEQEVWIYDFGEFYFKKHRLKKAIFKKERNNRRGQSLLETP